MSLLGMAWPVKRTDVSEIPGILEAGEGQNLAGRTRFYSRRWPTLFTQTTKMHKMFTAGHA